MPMSTAAPPPPLIAQPDESSRFQVAALQFAVLVVLWIASFRDVLISIPVTGMRDPEAVQILLMPILVLVLVWRRRHDIEQQMTCGSVSGLLLALSAIGFYVLPLWPLDYAGWLRLIPSIVLAAIVATVAGWRVMGLCLPMIGLLALATPLNSPHYPFFVVLHETRSLDFVTLALQVVPGIDSELRGMDLALTRNGVTQVIDFDDARSLPTLMLSIVSIALFVGSLRRRGMTRWLIAAPIALGAAYVCYLTYLTSWAVLAGSGTFEPDGRPVRYAAVAASLLVAWAASAMTWTILGRRKTNTAPARSKQIEAVA